MDWKYNSGPHLIVSFYRLFWPKISDAAGVCDECSTGAAIRDSKLNKVGIKFRFGQIEGLERNSDPSPLFIDEHFDVSISGNCLLFRGCGIIFGSLHGLFQNSLLAFHNVGLSLDFANAVSGGLSGPFSLPSLPADHYRSNKADANKPPCVFDQFPLYVLVVLLCGNLGLMCFGLFLLHFLYERGYCLGGLAIGSLLIALGFLGCVCTGYAWFFNDPLQWLPQTWKAKYDPYSQAPCNQSNPFHIADTVTQKLLTMPYYCNTLIVIGRANMANVLPIEKQLAIISALAEGSGIRQIERITGVHRDTIMRLGVRVGKTVWEGIVEVFDLKDHAKAPRAYAWAYETDNPKRSRHVVVLHLGPVTSPLLALRAAIVQEFRNREAAEAE